jgi:hypothetical protein
MRVLLITYYFPPDAAIGAVRPYQFAGLLPGYGITPWVLTVEPQFAETWDEQFVIENIPAERIIRTPVGLRRRDRHIKSLASLKSMLRRRKRGLEALALADSETPQAAESRGWMDATPGRRLLLSWLRFPDDLAGWYQPAIEAATRAHRRFNFDVIVSTSPPRVAHLIARELANRHGLPWLMDLRDPWYDEWNPGAPQSGALPARYRGLFKKCALSAGVIVLNTERLREHVVRALPELAAKAIAIPNGCDSLSSIKPPEGQVSVNFSIGHYGNVYDQRSGEIFLDGLRLWLDRYEQRAPSISVRFVGQEFGSTAERIERLNLKSIVRLCLPVPRRRALELMRDDYLLLLIANGQPVQVPGKLYEYLSAGRRILATTERDSATADLLRGDDDASIAQTAEEVATALQARWLDYGRGLSPEADHSRLLDECSYARRATALAHAIKGLAQPH